MEKREKKQSLSLARKKETLFYTLLLIVPMAQFLVYYVYVNLNSFLLAFQRYDELTGSYVWAGWKNFENMFIQLSMEGGILRESVFTSVKAYFLGLLTLPFNLLFPFYIYKKMPYSGFFKVVLYLPSILSTMVLGLLYQYFVDIVIPEIALSEFNATINPFLKNTDTRFWAAWLYGVLMSFGSNILVYCSAMSRIPESLSEYAKLEGCGTLREFFSITFPLIFPTFATFFITGIAAFFTNQLNLFTFFDRNSTSTSTVGYYVYCLVVDTSAYANYPMASAIGLFFTAIIAPVTLFVRWVMNRLDPSAQY